MAGYVSVSCSLCVSVGISFNSISAHFLPLRNSPGFCYILHSSSSVQLGISILHQHALTSTLSVQLGDIYIAPTLSNLNTKCAAGDIHTVPNSLTSTLSVQLGISILYQHSLISTLSVQLGDIYTAPTLSNLNTKCAAGG